VPYHRLIDPETLKWCADSGRFLFHKDTCSASKPILAKIQASTGNGTPFRFYNANIATLQFSVNKGASGFSGICANFYPQLVGLQT
jgi:4-hydroxy-tetrahydrodipicolinate synthase